MHTEARRGRRGALLLGECAFSRKSLEKQPEENMSRARPKIFLVIPLVAAVGGALLIARLFIISPRRAGERRDDEITAAPEAPSAEPQGLGRVKLAITVPSDSELTSVSYAVVNAGQIVVARGNASVEKQTGLVSPPAIVLPGGKGYTLSVVGNSTVGGVRRATYLGSGAFDVASDRDTPVSFTPNAGIDRAAGESAGAALPAGAAVAPVDNATACQSCELSSSQGVCASENITATSNTDPRTGDQTGVGWGCGTLADPKARSACLSLLHCLNVNGCGHPGESPVTGCYCGAAPAEDCMGGQGITGACIAEYQAAAVASPGGPASGAGGGQLSQFIATVSGDPTTPVGLANNIKHCALETSCDACQTL